MLTKTIRRHLGRALKGSVASRRATPKSLPFRHAGRKTRALHVSSAVCAHAEDYDSLNRQRPGWETNLNDYIMHAGVRSFDRACVDYDRLRELDTTLSKAEPCVSELVTSAAKELEDLEYDTFRANLKKSAEEYTAFVRSKLSMTRELASAGPLLIPDDLWSLLELEFTKADWELARQDVLSRLKEIQSQPIEVTSSVINQINTNNIVTLGFADSLLHKHNYRTSDLEALASEMYSSWLGSDSVRLFDYLNSGPSTRPRIAAALLSSLLRRNAPEEDVFQLSKLAVLKVTHNPRFRSAHQPLLQHAALVRGLVNPQRTLDEAEESLEKVIAYLAAARPLQAAHEIFENHTLYNNDNKLAQPFVFATLQLAMIQIAAGYNIEDAKKYATTINIIAQWNQDLPSPLRGMNPTLVALAPFLTGCLDMIVRYCNMAGSPSDLEPDGWNCLLASLIVQKRVFHQIDADDVSAVELIETTISRLQSTISTTNDENLKQEAQYALGQLLLARVPLDQNSIREAIGHLKSVDPTSTTPDLFRLLSVSHSMLGDCEQSLEYFFWEQRRAKSSRHPGNFFSHIISDALEANVPAEVLKSVVGLSLEVPPQQPIFHFFDSTDFLESLQEAMGRLGFAHISYPLYIVWMRAFAGQHDIPESIVELRTIQAEAQREAAEKNEKPPSFAKKRVKYRHVSPLVR